MDPFKRSCVYNLSADCNNWIRLGIVPTFYCKSNQVLLRINKSVSVLIRLLTDYRRPSLFLLPLLLVLIVAFFSYLSTDNNYLIRAQQAEQQMEYTRTGAPLNIVPGLTSNILTGVSFLIGTSSFILGLRIQSAQKLLKRIEEGNQNEDSKVSQSLTITKYYELLILTIVLPAIVINIYGILAVASHLYLEDAPYLLLLFVLFIPIGAILFLVKKLH